MSKKSIDLRQDPIQSSFFHYLMPAVTGMMIKAVYILTDSIFIGRGVGADGVAALALNLPVISFFVAISMMIGIGGAATMSIQFGKGNKREGQQVFVQSVLFALLLSGILSMAALYWLEDIHSLIGAQGAISQNARDYTQAKSRCGF